MNKLRVTVDGKSYEVMVEVLDGAPASIAAELRKPVASVSPASPNSGQQEDPPNARSGEPTNVPAGSNSIASPLSGKIVSIDVVVGQMVQEGVQVATIEAMKMNTFVYASKQGRINAVHVKAGDPVEEGAPLVDLG